MRIPAALASSSWLPVPLRYGWTSTLAQKLAKAAPAAPARRGAERSRHPRHEKRRVPDHGVLNKKGVG